MGARYKAGHDDSEAGFVLAHGGAVWRIFSGFPAWALLMHSDAEIPLLDVAGSKSWDAALTRICSWARLRDNASGCMDAADRRGQGMVGTWPSTWPRWLAFPIDHVLATAGIDARDAGVARLRARDYATRDAGGSAFDDVLSSAYCCQATR